MYREIQQAKNMGYDIEPLDIEIMENRAYIDGMQCAASMAREALSKLHPQATEAQELKQEMAEMLHSLDIEIAEQRQQLTNTRFILLDYHLDRHAEQYNEEQQHAATASSPGVTPR